jgi:hypothetical protein
VACGGVIVFELKGAGLKDSGFRTEVGNVDVGVDEEETRFGKHVGEVVTNDGEEAVRAAEGGVGGIPALDNQQARFTVRVPHVGGVYRFVGDGANQWKQTINGTLELPVGVSEGETFERELVFDKEHKMVSTK